MNEADAPLIPPEGEEDPAAAAPGAPPMGAEEDPGMGDDVHPRMIPGTDEESAELPATGAEQAELEQVVAKVLMLIHGKKSRDRVLQQIHDPELTVAQAVGRTAVALLTTIAGQKEAVTREPLSESVLHEALGYVVPELLKVGIAAGIFPFDDPDDEEPGAGNTPFDKQARLATLEAVKVYGERELAGPNAQRRSNEAQDDWARGVAQEVQSGQADPEYMSMAREALTPQGGGQAPPATDDAPLIDAEEPSDGSELE